MTSVGRGNPQIYYNVVPRSRKANIAELFCSLERYDPETSPATLGDLRDRLQDIAGARILVKELENGPPIAAPIAVRVLGEDLDGIARVAEVVATILRYTPGAVGHHARHHGAGPGPVPWDFLTTGSVRALTPILAGFGQDVDVDLDPATGRPTGTFSHVLRVFLLDRRRQVREIYTTAFLLPENAKGEMALINSSREIIFAGNGEDFSVQSREKAELVRNEINKYR